MAKPNAIKSGQAYFELYADNSKLVRGLKLAERKLRNFGQRVSEIGRNLAGLGASVAAPLALVGKTLTQIAGDAVEGRNRFNAVFGDMADDAEAFAQTLSKKVGRSVIETRDSLASFQGFFVGLGLDNRKALGLTKTVQQLATDFASFNNLSDAEGQQRFISALSGSSEVLDRFGVNIKQAALSQELLRQGVEGGTQAASEQQKVIARLSIIARSLGDQGAIGDAARTAGSWANTLKRLRGRLLDTAAAIGQQLIPVLQPALDRLVQIVEATKRFTEANRPLVQSLLKVGTTVAAVSGGAVVLGGALFIVGQAAIGVSAAIGLLVTPLKIALGLFAALGPVLAALVTPAGLVIAAVAGIGAAVLVVSGTGAKALDFLGDRFGRVRDDALAAFQGIRDALAAGDIELASKILWANLKLIWARGIGTLREAVNNFETALTKGIFAFATGFQNVISKVATAVQNTWARMTIAMADAYAKLLDFARPATRELAELFVRVYGKITGARQEDIDQVIKATLDDNVDRQINQRKRDLQRIRDQANADIDGNNRDLDKTLSARQTDLLAKFELLNKNNAANTSAIEAGADQLKKQLKELVQQAAREKADAPGSEGDGTSAPGSGGGGKLPGGDELRDQIAAITRQLAGGAAAARDAHAQTTGTFNPAAIERAFGGQAIQKLQLQAIEKLIDATKPIKRGVDDIRNQLPAYS